MFIPFSSITLIIENGIIGFRLTNQNTITFDFEDGKGPVPAHRHVNANGSKGGWIAKTATVAATAYVGKDARVSGNAWVSGNAQIQK